MRLTLSMLRSPARVPPETRVTEGGEFSIGRGTENDWVLPDPDRHLSKRHCMLAFRAGGWQVADLSSNGTFFNNEATPLGQGLPRTIRDGDRLRLGEFEIELQVGRDVDSPRDPFAMDPFVTPGQSMRAATMPDALPLRPAIGLPADFDPMHPDPAEEDYRATAQADHSAATSDAFRLGPAITALPADWADDLLPGPAVHVPAPPAAPAIAPAIEPAIAPPLAVPTLPAPTAAPAPPMVPDSALLAAFLRGAGLPPGDVPDPAATFEQMGQVMRELVSGLRRVLIARAAVKGEFRIEQTIIAARGNNPLKFAADDDDALQALIGTTRRTNMTPPDAVADALRDIRLHELAAMAAMQSAVRDLVASLDPAPLRRAAEGGMGLAMQHKARAWEAFEALHAQIAQSLTDDFDSVFGKSFARAYEQAQAEIGGKPGARETSS